MQKNNKPNNDKSETLSLNGYAFAFQWTNEQLRGGDIVNGKPSYTTEQAAKKIIKNKLIWKQDKQPFNG